jgi:hypothetical protein
MVWIGELRFVTTARKRWRGEKNELRWGGEVMRCVVVTFGTV